jgi:hypothetical protein
VDFEFHAPAGHQPEPLCVVASEVRSGRLIRQWLGDGAEISAPYSTDAESLFIAYYSSAELGCHEVLNWPMPARILDLYAEFRNLTNGRTLSHGRGLLGAMEYFRLDALAASEKKELRDLAIRGGPFTEAEEMALVDYCQTDVDALIQLLPKMLPHIDLPRALLRGRYMMAVAKMESNGIPVDCDTLNSLQQNWTSIKAQLIRKVDEQYQVFVSTEHQLDPNTRFGAAVLEAAKDWELDPYILAEAAEDIHKSEHDGLKEMAVAVRTARMATGLTPGRINRLQENGQDYTSVSGFDAQARELAGAYPELGIGRGYNPEGIDEDNQQRLWDLLSKPDPRPLPKHHPDIIRRAADLIGPDTQRSLDEELTFSSARWEQYLQRKGIPWPRLESGALALDDETFREMAKMYPAEIGPMRELRYSLGQMRLNELAVGPDSRNRTLLSVFASKTGRNQPSNSKFIFGPSCWLRSLIQPKPGYAIAYIDWSQQELAIAAALSKDVRMMEAYTSGDFYLTFAKMAGAVPREATKKTHGAMRDQFKVVSLGVLYGLSAVGLSRKLGEPPFRGRELLNLHQRTFRQFWEWSDSIEERAVLTGKLRTVFGWTVRTDKNVNPRSLRNFPMQANGAEMMRLAACLATERGIPACAPVHDAFLIEASIEGIETETERMQDAMREASEKVLPGFPLKTDAKIVRYPDRYSDVRGQKMWSLITQINDSLTVERLAMNEEPLPL